MKRIAENKNSPYIYFLFSPFIMLRDFLSEEVFNAKEPQAEVTETTMVRRGRQWKQSTEICL